MESKNKTIALKAILGIVGTAGAVFLVWKNYRNSKRELEEAHEQTKKDLVNLGLTEKDAEEAIEEEEECGVNDISLLAFKLATRGNSNYALASDFTDVDSALENTNVIHVRSDKNNTVAELIYQIPKYIENIEVIRQGGKGAYTCDVSRMPRCQDYMSVLRDFAEDWSNELGINIIRKLAGFITVVWVNPEYDPNDDDSDKLISDVIEISRFPAIYEHLLGKGSSDYNKALTRLYEYYLINGKFDDESNDKIHQHLSKVIRKPFEVFGMFLGVKLIAPQAGVSISGVTFEDLAEIVKDSVENLEISPSANNNGLIVQYDHVLYHPTDGKESGVMSAVYGPKGDGVTIFDVKLRH